MSENALTLISPGLWAEAIVWSLPGWLPLGGLFVLDKIDATECLLGCVAALALGGLIAGWRLRRLIPLIDWVDRLRDSNAPGPVPDSAIFAGLPHSLLRMERAMRGLRRQAAASDQLQRSLVDAVPDPVLVVDGRGYVRQANPSAEQHFRESPIDQPLGRFLRDPGILAAIDSAVRAGVSSTVDFRPLLERDRRYNCGIHPMITGDGRPAAILVLRETSEQVAIERMRSDFIANASHELRTPLTALAGFVETLKGPAKNDEAARSTFLDIMASEAARMVRLIDDLLSLSRVEAEANRPPRDKIVLADVVATALAGLEPQIGRHPGELQVEVPDALPQIRGDGDQLQQLVANLVDNALKYGKPDTPVRVVAELLEPASDEAGPLAGRSALLLSVVDRGEGIAPEHLPRLTERFYRVDKSRSRRAGGTGLGLAICKHIVKRHNGHLAVASRPGEGSTFQVYLPV